LPTYYLGIDNRKDSTSSQSALGVIIRLLDGPKSCPKLHC